MTERETTHFETDECRPPVRVRSRTWADSPNTLIVVEERRDLTWSRTGSVELGLGPVDARGVCADGQIAEWSHTHYHASGDRVRVDRRLVIDDAVGEYCIRLDERRRQVLGRGRGEHGWETRREWTWEEPAPGGRR